MEQDVGGMQPWQVFTAMFVGFWAISAYFDHFLLTGVFCIAFGVFGEIMTKVMYGESIGRNLERQKEELKHLLELVDKEESKYEDEVEVYVIESNSAIEQESLIIPCDEIKTIIIDEEEMQAEKEKEEEEEKEKEWEEEKELEEEKEWEEEEEEEEVEEEEPPPLPARDYESENIEIDNGSIEQSDLAIDNIDGNIPNIEVMNEIEEAVECVGGIEEAGIPVDDQPTMSFENMNGNIVEVGDILIPEADHYDETIENVEFEVPSQTDLIEADTNHIHDTFATNAECSGTQNVAPTDPQIDNSVKPSEVNGNELRSEEDINRLENNVNQNTETDIIEAANSSIIGLDEPILSNNDIIPSEVRPIEGDIDHDQEIISHDAVEVKNNTATTNLALNVNSEGCDTFPLESLVTNAENKNVVLMNEDISEEAINQNIIQDQEIITSEETEASKDASILPAVDTPGNPEIDIDLTDPAVEAAATKIQSAFKGFKIRKKKAAQ